MIHIFTDMGTIPIIYSIRGMGQEGSVLVWVGAMDTLGGGEVAGP